MYRWNVVPMCEAQLQDIDPKDVLEGGLYRKCNTYKGGGGYDQFPVIYNKRFGKHDGLNNQFVVQLQGCPLRCPYCYVTSEGIDGPSVGVYTDELVHAYRRSGCSVFHLMGGAPALYLEQWPELIEALDGAVFHSDLLLLEGEYSYVTLQKIAALRNSLYAVSIKGSTLEEYKRLTGTSVDMQLLWRNLDRIVHAGLPMYMTYTGMTTASIDRFTRELRHRHFSSDILEDAFAITLMHYKALDFRRM